MHTHQSMVVSVNTIRSGILHGCIRVKKRNIEYYHDRRITNKFRQKKKNSKDLRVENEYMYILSEKKYTDKN